MSNYDNEDLRKSDRLIPPALAEFAVSQLAEAGEQAAIDLTVQNVEILRAEIVKRDARIAELEVFTDQANAQMLEAFAELEQQRGGVVLPERQSPEDEWHGVMKDRAIGWNACLDEVARLNPPGECWTIPECPPGHELVAIPIDYDDSTHTPCDSVKTALTLLDFALSFALCNREHGGTRRDVKKAQAIFEELRALLAQQGKAVGDE